MTDREYARRLALIARTLSQVTNVSLLALVKEAGPGEVQHVPNIDELEQAVIATETADYWLEYSASKRVDSGWFVEPRDQMFVVGRIAENLNIEDLSSYSQKSAAVAQFLARELPRWVQMATSQHLAR